MIITLIFITIFVVGVACLTLYNHLPLPDWIGVVGWILSTSSGISLFIMISIIISSHINIEKQVYETQMERESIEKQIKCITNNYEDVSRASVIERVYEWNKEVYSQKYGLNNPWTSWFYSKRYVDTLDYIEMGE